MPTPLRPLIGIMCCNEFADRPIQSVSTRFLSPLAQLSGATAVLIPADTEAADVAVLSARLDGLLLTGSRSNVAGSRYGRSDGPAHTDEQRDQVALSLASRMIEHGRPVFGICRGFQELNVLFGGTLRDLDDDYHRAFDPGKSYESQFEHGHEVVLTDGGCFAGVESDRNVRVASAHQQGVERLGRGLAVEAIAPDGLVEAFSAPGAGAQVLAVQWHPEINAARCPVSRSFYRQIGGALRT